MTTYRHYHTPVFKMMLFVVKRVFVLQVGTATTQSEAATLHDSISIVRCSLQVLISDSLLSRIESL